MSKEEIMKIQTCVLGMNIHCDGCKHKVKKVLQKIEGVFTTSIDAEEGKVTVSGNVDPVVLIKKLAKSGKHAELWSGAQKNRNNQNHLASQLKNVQIDNGKGGNNKNQKGNNSSSHNKKQNYQAKGGHQLNPQQLQHLQQQQMKGFQDLKMPQLKAAPQNQKAMKFNLPEDDDLSDDEYDEDDDEFDYDDEELDDPHHPLNKMKPGPQPGKMMMLNGMVNGNHPQLKGGGGGNAVPVHFVGGGNGQGKNGNSGKKGGGGGNQNQGGGKHGGGGGKSDGGLPQDAKTGGHCGGGANKNGGGLGSGNNHGGGNGETKGNNGAPNGNDVFWGMGGPHGSIPTGQMGNMPIPTGQMGSIPMGRMGNISAAAVQGLPANAMAGGGGYFQGAGPDLMPGKPYHQQPYLAAVMNQQRPTGNERFQPMMYARPPPAVNYMPPYPYPYAPQPYPYTDYFSDENTSSSCNVM